MTTSAVVNDAQSQYMQDTSTAVIMDVVGLFPDELHTSVVCVDVQDQPSKSEGHGTTAKIWDGATIPSCVLREYYCLGMAGSNVS